jgi:hypothetical protein
MSSYLRAGRLHRGSVGISSQDREALRRLIDYAANEAIQQNLPVTARVLGLERESLASPTVAGGGLGGPESLNPKLKGQALQ